jgi:putative Holliday junction resolvase
MTRLLALDLGERRIGVAISDPTGTLARPLTTIIRASRREDFEAIADLVSANEAERVIVGLPLSLDGTEGPQARRVRRYADRLAQAVDVPLEFWDERYSSREAADILGQTKRGRREMRDRIDATAAAVILQSYLDAQTLAGRSFAL